MNCSFLKYMFPTKSKYLKHNGFASKSDQWANKTWRYLGYSFFLPAELPIGMQQAHLNKDGFASLCLEFWFPCHYFYVILRIKNHDESPNCLSLSLALSLSISLSLFSLSSHRVRLPEAGASMRSSSTESTSWLSACDELRGALVLRQT